MKKVLFFCFIFISIVWLSCKKDNKAKTDPQGKLHPVSFNITNFKQENRPIDQNIKEKVNAVATPDSTNILKLVYNIYDASNTLKKSIKIKKGAHDFGTIKDSLASGNYTAVFVGVTDTVHFTENATSFYYRGTIGDITTDLPLSETFYKKVSFTVGSTYLQQDIVLQRLNSQMQVVIKDTLPPGVVKITVNINLVDRHYDYFADKSNNPTTFISVPIFPASDKIGTANFTIGPIKGLIATDHTSIVTIIATSVTSAVIAKKTIPNVQFQRNTITILSGNLFVNDPATGGFVIGYEPYDPNTISQSF